MTDATTTEIATPEAEAEDKLFKLVIQVAQNLACHMVMTSDDRCDLDHAYGLSSQLGEVLELLKENPQFDLNHKMVSLLDSQFCSLIWDMYHYREYQEANSDLPLGIIEDYRLLSERLGEDAKWLDEIEKAFESDDDEDDDESDDDN